MNNDFSYPSPKELAKKEATRSISIRMKEKTMLAFEKLAQQYGCTASMMINNLLDSYVASLEDTTPEHDIRSSRKVMAQYLEKLAAKVASASDDDLFITLAKDDTFSNADGYGFEEYLRALKKPSQTDIFIMTEMFDDLQVKFVLSDCTKSTIKEEFDGELFIHYVVVPKDKYPVVANMVLGYLIKNEHLYNNKRSQKIDMVTLNAIVKTINEENDRTKLAKTIGRLLAGFEGVQDE